MITLLKFDMAGRPCKICKLKNSHPKAYQSITHQLKNGERGTMKKFLEEFNKIFKLNIIPMNVSRHKTHMEGNKTELKKKVKQIKKDDPRQIEVEVYSEKGELLYTNVQEIIDSMKPIHRTFCEALVNTYNHNATEAYQFAFECESYATAASQACRLLKEQNIILYINYLISERSKSLKISSSFVITGLLENYYRAMQSVPVLDKDGEPKGIYLYNGNVANKALELIGKHLQMWDKKERPENKELYHQIMERLLNNKVDPMRAGIEMDMNDIEIPEIVKLALRKMDSKQLEAPPIDLEDLDVSQMSDEELDRIIMQEK